MKRIYSLDFLRIVAAVFIIFHHYQQLTGVFLRVSLIFTAAILILGIWLSCFLFYRDF